AGDDSLVDRRSFVKLGTSVVGLLAGGASAQAVFPRRGPLAPQGAPLLPPPPPSGIPLARLAFCVRSGGNPHHLPPPLQEYIAATLTPNYAGQIVQAQAFQPIPANFHQTYWSDFRFQGQIPPTRTRYGYYTGVNELARSDAQVAIRTNQDFNYFEMRRVI